MLLAAASLLIELLVALLKSIFIEVLRLSTVLVVVEEVHGLRE